MDRINQHWFDRPLLLHGEIVIPAVSRLCENPRVIFQARATNASLSLVQGMACSGGTEHRGLWPAPIHFGPFPATYRAIGTLCGNCSTIGRVPSPFPLLF
jgi:hypothetical protein